MNVSFDYVHFNLRRLYLATDLFLKPTPWPYNVLVIILIKMVV